MATTSSNVNETRQEMRRLRVEEALRELDRAQKAMIESERLRRAAPIEPPKNEYS